MNKSKIPTIIGILILVVGVAVGVFLLNREQVFRLGASPDITPKDVRITNITDSGFTVSWVTDRETVGYLEWGETENTEEVAHEENPDAKAVHSVSVRNLSAQKLYFFTINSEGREVDDNGNPWEAETAPKLAPPTKSTIISGTVVQENGQPAGGILVYVTSPNLSPLSAMTTSNGKWVIPLSSARTGLLTSYVATDTLTDLEIFVQGGPLGISTAQATALNANPLPPITLGRLHDFRNQQVPTGSESPDAEINLPENQEKSSKFDVTDTGGLSVGEVTLESVENGEIIYTTQPEFFGTGPAGETITITVESDPVTDSVEVSGNGDWQWSPPDNLEPGEHKVTINWRDASGILRSLTRIFTVSAQEDGPAFESTPSGTPRTSPTASPTNSPTASPTSSPTIKPSPTSSGTPSATPRVTYPSTESGVPNSGIPLPTLVLALFGMLLVAGGAIVSKKL